MARFLTIFSFAVGLLARPAMVSAGPLDDYQLAFTAYQDGNYAAAASGFEALLPALSDAILVRESRKYLAAAYVHLDRESDAVDQFLEILRADADFRLAQHSFSAAVYGLFEQAQGRFRREQAQAAEDAEARRERLQRLQVERLLRQQERLARLEQLAREQVSERENSRGLALLPFGVGQFQNEERGLGIGFAVSEAILFVGSAVTWGWHRYLRGIEPDRRISFNDREQVVRISNQVITGIFAAVAITGILEAQIRFKPVIRTVSDRELPDDLPEVDLDDEGPEIDLGLGPGSATLRLRF